MLAVKDLVRLTRAGGQSGALTGEQGENSSRILLGLNVGSCSVRQNWTFRLTPVRHEGETDMLATMPEVKSGLQLELSEDHQMLQNLARDFARKEIIPMAEHYDRSGEWPWDIFKRRPRSGW